MVKYATDNARQGKNPISLLPLQSTHYLSPPNNTYMMHGPMAKFIPSLAS